MKRSQINALIRAAEQLFARIGIHLPEWAHWKPSDWSREKRKAELVIKTELGWDLTDFGSGDFHKIGLLLFTLRNGIPGSSSTLPYAEKLMIVEDYQVTPMHFHWNKTEDIINRAGAELVVKLYAADSNTEKISEKSFVVFRDAIKSECRPGDEIRLKPGQSITLTPHLYHTFWAEGGTCIVGEVSSVNDDSLDNRFLEVLGRFPEIEEDEPPYRLLCTDYKKEVQ